jgi:hypothetical protein
VPRSNDKRSYASESTQPTPGSLRGRRSRFFRFVFCEPAGTDSGDAQNGGNELTRILKSRLARGLLNGLTRNQERIAQRDVEARKG